MSLVVAAPCVAAADPLGRVRYYYQGDTVSDIADDELARFLGSGMLVEVADPEPEIEDVELVLGEGEPGGTPGPEGGQSPAVALERPKQSAPKEAWVAYAESRGVDKAEAEALTKTELIQRLV